MHRDNRISVVIPCYNEEHGLPRVLAKIPAAVDEVLVLDNCSTDRTAEVAAADPRVRIVRHPRNLGYGGSYIRGLPMAGGDILVTTDGDGTYPVQDCVGLVDALLDQDLDFLSCSRFPLQNPRGMRRRNQIGNAGLTLVLNVLYGLHLRDGQSGMWVFKKRALEHLRLGNPGMAFSNEIKIEAFTNSQIRAAEHSIHYAERIGESKLYPLLDGIKMVAFMLRRRLRGPAAIRPAPAADAAASSAASEKVATP